MLESWLESIEIQLKERDVYEKRYDELIEIFSSAAERASRNRGPSSTANDDEEEEITRLYTDLSIKEDKLTATAKELHEVRKHFKTLKQFAEAAQTKYEKYKHEAQQTNRQVQHLEDDILALQIQLNVSEDKIKKLQEENEQIVNRWMERVAGEAEKLNEANAFIESLNRMKKESQDESSP
ncbi:hypothetical protein TRVA0_006S02432 [Trichomonascus vanleenenianus]|uniref:uncharacterized protein n=1 Tax=Trichomonascus vanleenenianus TaxID=2268995 RepID=UPI003ECAC144